MINSDNFSSCELIVRKRTVGFIEKYYRFCGCDIRHDVFKSILYGETEPIEPKEEKIKNYYDAYMYLLHNARGALGGSVLKRFFFILDGEIKEESRLMSISTHYFKTMGASVTKALTDTAMFMYNALDDYEDDDRLLITLMFINYTLVKYKIPTVQFLKKQIREFSDLVKQNDKDKMANLLADIVNNAKYQDKSYYKNLRDLDFLDIVGEILAEREELSQKYKVKHVYLFGSFAKGAQRIDSDIDIACEFSLDISHDKKLKMRDELTEHLQDNFKRYVDIHTVGEYLTDETINQLTPHKKIF